MDPPTGASNQDEYRRSAERTLLVWASRLVTTAGQIARTEVVHGYTGRWDFALQLSRWRDLVIPPGGYVQVNGYFDLHMPAIGQAGRGLGHATILFRSPDTNPDGTGYQHIYQGEYRTAHEITNAVCSRDGSLDLAFEAFALQRVTTIGSAATRRPGIAAGTLVGSMALAPVLRATDVDGSRRHRRRDQLHRNGQDRQTGGDVNRT
jgi:hypothetical protein